MDFAAATEGVLGQILVTMGEAVTYAPTIGSPYAMTGVFDENYEDIQPNGQTIISSTQPALLVRLSDMHVPPAKGDRLTVRTSRQFTVTRSKPDGRGGALLILHKV